MIRRRRLSSIGSEPTGRAPVVETLSVVFVTGGAEIGITGTGAIPIQFQGKEAIYFEGKDNRLFFIGEYNWEGPKFTMQSTTSAQRVGGSSSLRRAAVGAMVGGRRGALVGAATSRPGRVVEQTTQEQVEEPALATILLVEKESNKTTTVKFTCTSAVHTKLNEMKRVLIEKKAEDTTQTIRNLNGDPMDEIRKFKSLLDEGIITPEEFDQKKKELLGL